LESRHLKRVIPGPAAALLSHKAADQNRVLRDMEGD
jgi:hypothetical protein